MAAAAVSGCCHCCILASARHVACSFWGCCQLRSFMTATNIACLPVCVAAAWATCLAASARPSCGRCVAGLLPEPHGWCTAVAARMACLIAQLGGGMFCCGRGCRTFSRPGCCRTATKAHRFSPSPVMPPSAPTPMHNRPSTSSWCRRAAPRPPASPSPPASSTRLAARAGGRGSTRHCISLWGRWLLAGRGALLAAGFGGTRPSPMSANGGPVHPPMWLQLHQPCSCAAHSSAFVCARLHPCAHLGLHVHTCRPPPAHLGRRRCRRATVNCCSTACTRCRTRGTPLWSSGPWRRPPTPWRWTASSLGTRTSRWAAVGEQRTAVWVWFLLGGLAGVCRHAHLKVGEEAGLGWAAVQAPELAGPTTVSQSTASHSTPSADAACTTPAPAEMGATPA